MKVFRVSTDVNRFQYFLPERKRDHDLLNFDGSVRYDSWHPPKVRIYKPTHERGDFFNFDSSALIASKHATEVLLEFFEASGELLPLPFGKETFTVVNITECVNCLNRDATHWWFVDEDTGERYRPEKYVFNTDLLPEAGLFKIPETVMSEVLIIEGLKEPHEEFRFLVKKHNLKGLVFEELWRLK